MLTGVVVNAQTDNSPYSRYGLGDVLPSQNIMSRGIGGVSAAYADVISVNFQNPASYAKLKRATFDFGLEVDSRTLRVLNPPRKFSSVSPTISYIQLGLPLSKTKNWGMNIGLRPVTKINYSIQRLEKNPNTPDSINSLFEGSGGTYEVYTGTGFGIKDFTFGFNIGYLFGTKDYSTKRYVGTDSLFYYPSLHRNSASFGGLFANAGFQYTIRVNKTDMLRLGGFGRLKSSYRANREQMVQTFEENATTGQIDSIDVISRVSSSGKIIYPATYGVGLMFYKSDKWLFGADFTQTKWSDYRFFNEADMVQDSWTFHLGGQVLPDATAIGKSYWNRVTYRAGFNYGRNYVHINDQNQPMWGASIGFGFPMRPPSYSNQYSIINTSFEFGKRGNTSNEIQESFFKVGVGLTLSDIWFIKRRYD